MDWKRAKTLLILVFIILNIVLACQLYTNFKVEDISQQTIYNTQKILEQSNVHIECPISKYKGKDYMLQYEEKPIDTKKIVNVLLGEEYIKSDNNTYIKGNRKLVFNSDSGFEFTDSDGYNKIYTDSKDGINIFIKELSAKMDIPFNDYKMDGYYPDIKNDNGAIAIYTGIYNGYNVFDNYISVEIRKTGITSIKYQYKKPIRITSKDINVIPAYQILITKLTEYPGITIRDVDLGFKGYTNVDKETKTLYEGLAWRIKTPEGNELFFKASNGEKIE